MSESADSIKYAAFVSYRHKPEDRRWAMWLIETLETFETPPLLVQRGVPPKIGLLFRDDGEMAANADIGRYIRGALWASKYLIVVCSPDTPQSKWVRTEIELFKHWGRAERILTLLIAGPTDAVIPPELRDWRAVGSGPETILELTEPAGANVAPQQGKTEEELKDLARDKLASVLLGCSFAELRDRQVERLQRETATAYFETQVRRWGVPEGVGPLSENIVARRHVSLRFEKRGGLVRRVQRVNGQGMLRDGDDGVAQWDVTYRSDGSVESIEHRNRHGQVKQKESFSKNLRFVDFLREDDVAAPREAFHGEMGFDDAQLSDLRRRKAGIVRHMLEFDGRGFISTKRYASDQYNTAAQDALGNFGEGYELNAVGQPTRTWYLDVNSAPCILRNGVTLQKDEYDPYGRRILSQYFGENGTILGNKGFSNCISAFDDNGNEVETTYFGVDGEPVFHKDGFARSTRSYDARGNVIEWAYFGVDGKPVPHKDGYARLMRGYDARGNPVEWDYFGVDGKPILDRNGIARWTRSYDARGNPIEWAYFGIDGEPVLHKNGYARVTLGYDARGNPVEWAFFGVDGKPILDRDGIARWTRSYDARGNPIEWAYFGIDGEPVLHKNGYARLMRGYDARGNPVEWAFLGVDGEPVQHKDGYARTTRSYDARGNVIEWACFGVDGEPVMDKDGVARWAKIYNERGDVIEKRRYGSSGSLIEGRYGFAGWRNTWDSRGSLVAQTYFGTDNQPCLHTHGYASATATYDHYGRMIETIFRGLDGQPVNRVGDYAKAVRQYKPGGEEMSTAYFDATDDEVFPTGEDRWDFKMEE